MSESSSVGESKCWRVRVLECPSVRESESQSIRVSECLSVGESECQSVRVSAVRESNTLTLQLSVLRYH